AAAVGASAEPHDFSKPLKTPYARQETLAIRGVTIAPESVPRYGQVEMTVDLTATYDNPFDAGDFTLDARILTPSKKKVDVPGFYYQPFSRELTAGKEVLTPVGRPSWRIRYSPKEVGVHTVTFRVHDRSGAAVMPNRRFTVTPSQLPGMVRVSPRDPRYFEHENGRSYFPIGANIAWAGPRGTFDYDKWLPAYRRAGCNYARLWLSPEDTTFGLQRTGAVKDGRGAGQLDLANAWRLDQTLATAKANGMFVTLALDSQRTLAERAVSAPLWAESIYNAKNGGPLRKPTDFWTDETAEGLYLNKLRYVVARFGASPNVLAWELWNDVDLTTGYRSDAVKAWHAKITGLLRKLDPHGHPITTTFSRLEGDPAVDGLAGIDFVQTHQLGGPDSVPAFVSALQSKARYKKPHLVSEAGWPWQRAQPEVDPEGIQIRAPLWASIASGASGGAAPWNWDSYIEPQQLYGAFTAASKFAAGIDWPAEKLRTVRPRMEWVKRPRSVPFSDLPVPSGAISWAATEFNKPRTVSVTDRALSGQAPVAGIQHGIQAHPELHNPVTFQVDLQQPTRLELLVDEVSGNGGAVLKATVDGKSVLEFDFADTDPGLQPLRQYAGAYNVQIPTGKHTVVIENVGRDWFLVTYRLLRAIEPTRPAIEAWASVGNRTAVAWVRNQDYTWQRAGVEKQLPKPQPPSVLVLPGVAAGSWKAELWDTWTGKIMGTQSATVGKNGEARISLPALSKDLAVRMRRTVAGKKL
ncbi:MAG: DUF5060 domain-containing protein, partial [Actinomycetota bacterium]